MVEKREHNHIRLPEWLDDIIFNEFGAEYNPQPKTVQYTPDNKDFDKTYLGTYFPRSFAEAYCIFEHLLNCENYLNVLAIEQELNILDFCCGTGGEILGLISLLQEKLPNLKRINLDIFDANQFYIFNIFQIIKRVQTYFKIEINVNPQCIFIENDQHLEDIVNFTNSHYNIIMSFKALNEFIQGKTFPNENIYKKIAEKFLPLLNAFNGILILSDLTSKNTEGNFYYPTKLNEGLNELIRQNNTYKTIFPFTCHHFEQKCDGCYMQAIIYVSHSRKQKDISKVAYRIIGKTELADHIASAVEPNICRYVDNSADKNSPYKIN